MASKRTQKHSRARKPPTARATKASGKRGGIPGIMILVGGIKPKKGPKGRKRSK